MVPFECLCLAVVMAFVASGGTILMSLSWLFVVAVVAAVVFSVASGGTV